MKKFKEWYVQSIHDWITAKSFKAVFKGYLLAYVTVVVTLAPVWYYFPHHDWVSLIWCILYLIFVFGLSWSKL